MKSIFERLYEDYHQDLFQFIMYMVKDYSIAEDLVQEVYTKVLRSYRSFKGESSEKTWLFSIAKHVTYDFFRKERRKKQRIYQYFDWDKRSDSLRDETDLPEEIAIKNDEVGRLYKYLDYCTKDQKSVLILRFIMSFSVQETADILQFSVSKVKTTQHRALKRLRKILTEKRERGEW